MDKFGARKCIDDCRLRIIESAFRGVGGSEINDRFARIAASFKTIGESVLPAMPVRSPGKVQGRKPKLEIVHKKIWRYSVSTATAFFFDILNRSL